MRQSPCKLEGSRGRVAGHETTGSGVSHNVLHKLGVAALARSVSGNTRKTDAFPQPRAAELAVEGLITQQTAGIRLPECYRPDDPADDAHPSLEKPEDQHQTPGSAEAAEDSEVFQAVLQGLGVRAQHALAHGRVQELSLFMRLRSEVMLDWPNTGAKTVAEILHAQERLAELFDTCKSMGRALCIDEVCLALGQPIKPAQRLSGRLAARKTANTPTPVSHGPDEPEPWSVLRNTIPELLCLDDREASSLIAAAQQELIGDVLDLPADGG